MRRLALPLLAVALTACGSQSTPPPPPRTVTSTPTTRPVPPTRPPPTPVPTPTVTVSKSFAAFRDRLCGAFARNDASAAINLLPYYQYNDGVRYGYLGDGEGQSGDPNLLRTWLAGTRVRCLFFTPDVAGHALLLTNGWPLPHGSWNLIEADTFNGTWKINDFTFGTRAALYRAMQVMQPILPYRG
ncbi:MAG: hypothetical protein JOZ41_07085 [Chloroflexi bacterium]|nr:hypothetical protein [Chloroflexota bacterium]